MFSLAPLDTQRIVYAIIIGHENTHFNSIVDLKRNTNFIRDTFFSEFKVKAIADTEVRFLSEISTEVLINACVKSDTDINSVRAEFFDFSGSKIHEIELFDDGFHHDRLADDDIFGNTWQSRTMTEALSMNLIITDINANEYLFNRASENITILPDSLEITSITVVDDHINFDNIINPGENIRLKFSLMNNHHFDMKGINISVNTDDPYVQMENRHGFVDNLSAGNSKSMIYDYQKEESFVSMTISEAVPDTHTIAFDVSFFDNLHHVWHQCDHFNLKVHPFDYLPNEIIPGHIAGYSDAYFVIRVVNPNALTGHTYNITVIDLTGFRQGFNLIDQTLGDTLLARQEPPIEYAYNIPVTDGFKVVEAYLPPNLLKCSYQDISGGHPYPFNQINASYGQAPLETFYDVEIDFTNDIDPGGVIGLPAGQGGFIYYNFLGSVPAGFLSCPFNVWRIENGQRVNKLNVCFTDNPLTHDEIWSLDDWLYIMFTEYDSSGQYYYDPTIAANKDVIYQIKFGTGFASDSSMIDAGDKILLSRQNKATSEDKWRFVPTNVKSKVLHFPASFSLFQNYPNPFNQVTTIRFSLEKTTTLSLKIYNILGQEIMELFDKELSPGIHSIQWDGKNSTGRHIGSGLYFAKIETKNQTKLIKMLLIR